MSSRPRLSFPLMVMAKALGVLAGVIVVVAVAGPSRAMAEEPAAKVAKLNKQGLDAFDNLNFDQAKTFLEQAIAECDASDLARDPAAARSHLNLGMVLIAGFQQRDQAVEHFKMALKIQPDIAAPAGLFNPEVQAVFDEVKAAVKTEPVPEPAPEPPARPSNRPAGGKAVREPAPEAKSTEDESEETEEAPASSGSKLVLSVGLGSGLGIARGHLDANKDSLTDSKWAGGVAPSTLGHVMLGAGYFISPDLMLSLEGRIQFISGTTVVKGTQACPISAPCSAPSTGIAVLAKASWFLSPGPVRPFLTGGLGGGSIRQVVKINVQPNAANLMTGCGNTGNEPTCVDTVTGGPFFLVAGAGLAYEIGKIALLGSLTANVGLPSVMLNVDALIGLGLYL